MVFVACGLNHKTAPLQVREKVALPSQMQEAMLSNLLCLPEINEATILSTCNRTEIYCDTEHPERLTGWLANNHDLDANILSPYLYIYPDQQGIRHTLRVASGLDSMMIGEPQILGQLKEAYQRACQVGGVKHHLRSIFEYVFSATKRIRNQSGIGNNPISIAYAAAQLIKQTFENLKDLTVFLIGSGETSRLVAKYLQQEGIHKFIFASRTLKNAQLFATDIHGETITITEIPQYLPRADIVISATSCPLPFVNKAMVETALTQRSRQSMFFLDLAVPRDVDPSVGEIPDIYLYNIDDLKTVVMQGLKEREFRAHQAEALIEIELDNYIRWHRTLKAKDVIREYRDQMKELANQELQRSIQKLSSGKCQYDVLQEFSERLVNKLIHLPTMSLRQAAYNNQQELLELAKNLLKNTSYEKIT